MANLKSNDWIFLDRLRSARNLPASSDVALDARGTGAFALRFDRAEALLSRPLDCGTRSAVPLSSYLAKLAYRAGADISLDELEILQSGISPLVPVSVEAGPKPLAEILTTALEPVGLSWRVVDGSTLEVTSPSKIDESAEIEFYRLPTAQQRTGIVGLKQKRNKLVCKD